MMPPNHTSFRGGEFADLWKLVADTPDPVEFARYLPADLAEMLTDRDCTAWNGHIRDDRAWRALRRKGLADYVSPNLSVFGAHVRRALISGEA